MSTSMSDVSCVPPSTTATAVAADDLVSCTASYVLTQVDIEQGQALPHVVFTAITGQTDTGFRQEISMLELVTKPAPSMEVDISTLACTAPTMRK